MDQIKTGQRVLVTDAFGSEKERVALSGIVQAPDLLVVWVASDEELAAAKAEGREPEGIPWPAEDVRPVKDHAHA
jgi:hypothetical protein